MLRAEFLHKILLLLTVPAAVFLFYPSVSYYFFQDDWFVLNWVQDSDLVSLLKFRTDIIYWRPFSMPLFFKITSLAFGLNPFAFHLLTFIFHLLNSSLIYLLFRQKFTRHIAAFTAFLYATAAFHFIPLSWLSTTSYVIGPTFILGTLLFFLKDKPRISLIFFLLGLASSELTLTAIPVAFLLSQKYKKAIFALRPFLAVALVYLVTRFVIFPLPQQGQYELAFAPKIATNVFWYFAASFNMPEAISTVFYFSNIRGSLAAAGEFWKYFTGPILLAATWLALTLITRTNIKEITRAAGLFLAGIFPVILLPFHFYPMYIVVASLGVFYALAAALAKLKSWQTPTVAAFALIWFVSSFLTLSFTRTNHWVANLESISKVYVNETLRFIKDPQQGPAFLFRNPDIEFAKKYGFTIVKNEQNIRQALNDQDAMQVIYKDKSAKSFYETDSGVPQVEADKLFVIWPRE